MKETIQVKREEAIQKRLKEVLPLYKGHYLRAVKGKSRPAAIKAFCLECIGWERKEITQCTALACPLWPVRPYQKPPVVKRTAEQQSAINERMKKARACRVK